MKKLSIVAVLLLCVLTMSAQHPIFSFFDQKGAVRQEFETTEPDAVTGTLVSVFHRSDDVVYSRVIYRVIDVRYKQNYQLYFPTNPDDPQYQSLFRLMLDAIVNGLEVYEKGGDEDIKPHFENPPLKKSEICGYLNTDRTGEGDGDFATSDYVLLNYDSISDQLRFNGYSYGGFAKNQLKWLIQEIVFFDKHYSRLYSKIIAIAPLQADNIAGEDTPVIEALMQSILFWIPFDSFRPYLMAKNLIPEQNDNRRVTFDEFFAKKLYSSYIIGDSNMFDRMIGKYALTETEVRKEQERIATELLNFEQDLWEY